MSAKIVVIAAVPMDAYSLLVGYIPFAQASELRGHPWERYDRSFAPVFVVDFGAVPSSNRV